MTQKQLALTVGDAVTTVTQPRSSASRALADMRAPVRPCLLPGAAGAGGRTGSLARFARRPALSDQVTPR